MTKASGARAKVMEYLIKNAGLPVFLRDLAEATGLTPTQARSAVYSINYSDVDSAKSQKKLQVIVPGHQWMWHQKPPNGSGPMFEQVAELNDGSVLQQDEEGVLWRASKVNLS